MKRSSEAASCLSRARSNKSADTWRSVGCYWFGKIPLGDEALPVSRELCVALAGYFAVFNELLFAAAALAKSHEGDPKLAGTFATISAMVGVVVLFAWHAMLLLSDRRSIGDFAFGLVSWATIGAGLIMFSGSFALVFSTSFALGNLLMVSWLSLGVLRLWLSKKRESASTQP